jgi:hypothetical protein
MCEVLGLESGRTKWVSPGAHSKSHCLAKGFWPGRESSLSGPTISRLSPGTRNNTVITSID